MFNTNNLIKLGASAAGALLIMLFANWGATALYKVADDHHGDEEHAVVRGFNIGGDDEGAGEQEEEIVLAFADVYAEADPAKGERAFGKCRACHKLEEGAHTTGPSLFGIVGHEKAAMDGFAYSDALLDMAGETWTPENLDAWLEDPRGYAPGNKMTFAGLKNVEERADLIAYLATFGG